VNVTDCDTSHGKSRPRSLVEVDSEGIIPMDLASTIKRRWSGVHIGSKLINALDKLVLEDLPKSESEDYTDSIDNPPASSRVKNTRRKDSTDAEDIPSDNISVNKRKRAKEQKNKNISISKPNTPRHLPEAKKRQINSSFRWQYKRWW